MLKTLFYSLGCITFFAASVFMLAVVGYLVSTEILPSIGSGSLNVDTTSMILNISWVGNEIYALLAAYVLVAVGFAYGSVWLFRKAIRK